MARVSWKKDFQMASRQGDTAASEQAASFEGISSVTKLSLPDQVFNSLRDALMSGRFAPGQRVPLRSIASALGTSTMPAREAVNRLISIGALELLPNRRVAVPILSAERYREIAVARGIIEPAAAERATLQLSDADLQILSGMHQKMAELVKQIDQEGAAQERMKLDKAFFFKVYSANGSPVLMSTIESFWIKTGPYLNILMEGIAKKLWFNGDRVKPVLDALLNRDPEEVRRAVFSNIQTAFEYVSESGRLGETGQTGDDE
jgi:DNA-binding GntR family transcriptional regulator